MPLAILCISLSLVLFKPLTNTWNDMMQLFRPHGNLVSTILLLVSLMVSAVNLGLNFELNIQNELYWNVEWSTFSIREWLLSGVALAASGIIINTIYQKFEFTHTKNSYAGIFYILLVNCLPQSVAFNNSNIIVLLLLLALYNLFLMYRRINKAAPLFNVGFLIGLVIILDTNYWSLSLVFLAGIFSINFLKAKEFLLYFISILIPILFYHIIMWTMDPMSFPKIILQTTHILSPVWFFRESWTVTSFVVLIYLFYIFNRRAIARDMRMKSKTFLNLIDGIFLFLIVLISLIQPSPADTIKTISIPLAIMLGVKASVGKNNRWPNRITLFLILMYVLQLLL